MADSVQCLKINSISGEAIAYPKTLASAVYSTPNTTSGPTVSDFMSKHSHHMADIVDLNINPDGQLLLQSLNILINGVNRCEYNGLVSKSLDISLVSLGAAPLHHTHDDRYALLNHTHSEYAPLVHTHSISDITDYNPGAGGTGEIQPLTIQFNGFDNLVFDGKTAKSLNISPDIINAADRSHTHSKLDITDLSMAKLSITLKNMKFNDATGSWVNEDTVVEYTGATEVFINLSADQIGAASVRHYHDDRYALTDHNHDTVYYKKNEIDTKFISNGITGLTTEDQFLPKGQSIAFTVNYHYIKRNNVVNIYFDASIIQEIIPKTGDAPKWVTVQMPINDGDKLPYDIQFFAVNCTGNNHYSIYGEYGHSNKSTITTDKTAVYLNMLLDEHTNAGEYSAQITYII